MRRKTALREKACQLRSKGYSYSEIVREVPVSKSSISLWCRDVPLSVKQKAHLKKLALEGAADTRNRWVEIRKIQKAEVLQRISRQTAKDIGELSKRDRFIAGVMLYAGEGDRAQERVGMANTNPRILSFMLDWFCEFLELDRSRFVAHLYLHVGRSERKAKRFWTRALRVDQHQIKYVYRPTPRKSRKGKNVHEFGVCSVRIHNKMAHRKITGWVQATLNNNNRIIPG